MSAINKMAATEQSGDTFLYYSQMINKDTLTARYYLDEQKRFFEKGLTRDTGFRIKKLKDLRRSIQNNEKAILEALQEDLKKPVITSNQATMWRLLRLANINTELKGFGRLFHI